MPGKIYGAIHEAYADEEKRRVIIFNIFNILLMGVSLFMTGVNFNTKQYELMGVTGFFALLCLLNFLCTTFRWAKRSIVFMVFTVEAMILLVYFVLSGVPEGFSVLWTLLVPAVSMYIFGQKIGVRFSLLTLAMIIFFFWIPLGRGLLYYDYNKTFMLRFPFVYMCIFLSALYIDVIRIGVYKKMRGIEERSRWLYRHDALTGIYSRYAFKEELAQLFSQSTTEPVAAVLLDIDDFKEVNDKYGHAAGDVVLIKVAELILDSICEHSISCRWGGEEFLIFMRCGHDPLELAERLRSTIATTPVAVNETLIKITASFGVALVDKLALNEVDYLINLADKTMYKSKAQGKNCVNTVRIETTLEPTAIGADNTKL